LVHLPGWKYPAVVDLANGSIAHDVYNGAWGEMKELDRLLQAYAIEKCRIEARRAGQHVTESVLSDGSIRLSISAGGGA
jgi:hypothetical protein